MAIRALDTPSVCRFVALAPATLDYWIRSGLVTPSIRPSSGRRVPRLWAVEDVVLVRSIKALREAGCPLQKVREVKALLDTRWSESLRDYVLYWDGGDVVGLDRWGNLRSLLSKPSQQMLHVLAIPIDRWRDEADSVARVLSDADLSAPSSRTSRTATRRLSS